LALGRKVLAKNEGRLEVKPENLKPNNNGVLAMSSAVLFVTKNGADILDPTAKRLILPESIVEAYNLTVLNENQVSIFFMNDKQINVLFADHESAVKGMAQLRKPGAVLTVNPAVLDNFIDFFGQNNEKKRLGEVSAHAITIQNECAKLLSEVPVIFRSSSGVHDLGRKF
jgi:hypothetical protein